MFFLFLFVSLVQAAPSQSILPIAPERPFEHKMHGDTRPDPYFWLRDLKDPATLPYLRAENAYAEQVMQPYRKLRTSILRELKSYIKQSDTSYPVKDGSYLYFYRLKAGANYPLHYRKHESRPKSEELLLDENTLAKGSDYTAIGALTVSDRSDLMAYTLDTKGDRLYTIYIKDLKTGKKLKDRIEGAGSELVWGADGKTLFYVRLEPGTLRARWIYRHSIENSHDEVVYEEKDEKFDVELTQSLTKKYVFVVPKSRATSETWYLDAEKPFEQPKLFQPRSANIQYSVEDGGDRFYILTNLNAENFRLMESSRERTTTSDWKEVIPHRPEIFIEHVLVQRGHLVSQQRRNGIPELEVRDRLTNTVKVIAQTERDPFVTIGSNRDYNAGFLRYRLESLITPPTTYDYDYKSGEKTIRHVNDVPGGFRSSDYIADRIEADGHDGTKIPISIVYKKGVKASSTTPLFLNAYGSYEWSSDPEFDRSILPLLNRGFIYAIAHVRGGADLGRSWYLNGKLMKKKNTFFDFISAAEFLAKNNWTSTKHLYIKGVSAGGLLMGAVMNMRPDLFNGVIADVPFVDVMTTMLDASLPLTTGEYEEWGNPNDKAAYDYMRSYSPYDNVRKQAYPSLLVRAGLNDTQVGYWEPAKWVARLRKMKTDSNPLLFRTELEVGHSGKNGRFSGLGALALENAFILMLEERNKPVEARK